MEHRDLRVVWGALLILGGIFFLLGNLGILDFTGVLWSLLWMGIFGIAGLAFLVVLALNRENWWAAIPGFALLGLAGTVAVDLFLPQSPLGGTIFLGSIGLGFLFVYLFRPENWWAIIPGGVLLTLSLVTVTEPMGLNAGAILFLGMGVTFAVVALLPTPQGRMHWAFIPAGVLFVMGVAIGFSFEVMLGYIWPAALILGGLFLLFRSTLGTRNR
jgi:hypothetical protein